MDEPTETLAQRLKLARRKRGLTQVQLAKLAGEGVQQSDISKLERGDALATSAIARLARALRVPSAWLEENEGGVPDWDAVDVKGAPIPVSLSESELVAQLRPEWRELILAFEELLPEDRDAMVQPILKRAEDMRRHFEAALARQGIHHRALTSTGNQLPLAPQPGPERRQVILGRDPERRTPQPIIDSGSPPPPTTIRKEQK